MVSPQPPQAAGPSGPSGIAQDANMWSTPVKAYNRPSVNNMKARTQHILAAIALRRHFEKRDIAELTKVERVVPEGAQEVHTTTLPTTLPTTPLTVDTSLKRKLNEQFWKMGGGKSTKESNLYTPGAIILNELTRLWYKSQPNPPPYV